MNINLWEETIEVIEDNKRTWDDVTHILGTDFQISKENYERVAKKTYYNSGFGAAHVAEDLVIYGASFLMKRGEYDGSEWWEFVDFGHSNNLPVVEINKLAGGMWSTLKEINGGEYESKGIN